MPDQSAITAALEIGATAATQARTIDITTTGAKSGEARRIEIWFHQIQGRWYAGGIGTSRATRISSSISRVT